MKVVRELGLEGREIVRSYLPLVFKRELREANPSTIGLGWVNLWCTGCYANTSAR